MNFPSLLFAIIVAHADLSQSGAFPDTVLTTRNVTSSGFGIVGSYQVDVPIFAQPIVAPAVNGHDLLIVATLTNKVYAFDANMPGTKAIWTTLVGPPQAVQNGFDNFSRFTGYGIFSTPAIDTTAGVIYVCGAAPNSWVLYKLSLATGAILASVAVTGQFPGTGDSSVAGQVHFVPTQHVQRAALAVANSVVYLGFSGVLARPWHGWIFSYNTADLSQAGVLCTTPNNYGGGVWMGAAGPSIDASGNAYFTTGDGAGAESSTDFPEAVLKVSPSLSVLDYFIPSIFASMDSGDEDLSSGRFLLIPGTTAGVVTSKNFVSYVIDTTCMGHLEGSSGCSLQKVTVEGSSTPGPDSGSYGAVFVNSSLVVPTTAGNLHTFNFTGSTMAGSASLTQTNNYGFPGPAQLSYSNGIIWLVASSNSNEAAPDFGVLHAINASTYAELWNSATNTADTPGHLVKFASPMIYNGRVYSPNQDGQIQVYGLR